MSDGSIVNTRIIGVDADYLSTLEISLLEGRNFSEDRTQDRDQAVLINETLATRLGAFSPERETETWVEIYRHVAGISNPKS